MPSEAALPLIRDASSESFDSPDSSAARGGHDVRALLDDIAMALRNDRAALAAALGVCRSDLWRWEAGERPSPQECDRIAQLARQAGRLVADGAVRGVAIAPRRGEPLPG